MDLNITVDNIKFQLNKELIEKQLNRLKLMYKLKGNQAFLCLILLDDIDTRKYVTDNIKEYIQNIYCVDNNLDLKEFNKKIKETPTIILELENYFKKLATDRNISIYDAKDLFYQTINMCRDSIFLEYNSQFFMFLNDEDFFHFMVTADDFFSYCQCRLNFNECFINKENITLDNYYKQKQLEKVLKKRPQN